jgi:hypothetical protein
MPTTQQREESKDKDKEGAGRRREALTVLIGDKVMKTLGAPGDLLKMQVRPLWENYYRVNVFIGKDAGSAQIAKSYFVTADGDGNILTSAPEIIKQY